jgi:cytochrome c oxidase subunit 4
VANQPVVPSNAPSHAPSHAEEHASHGPGRYFVIWFVLLGFTGLTVWTGRMDLGAANIGIALAIATIKATLVVLFFMHLSDSHGANRLVFLVSVLFLVVLLVGVFGDLLSRAEISLPSGAPAFDSPETSAPAPR